MKIIEQLIIEEHSMHERLMIDSNIMMNPTIKDLPYLSSHGFISIDGDLYIETKTNEDNFDVLSFLEKLNQFDKSIAGGHVENYTKDLWIIMYGILITLHYDPDPKSKRNIPHIYLGVPDSNLKPDTRVAIRHMFDKAFHKNPNLTFNIKYKE